MADTLSITAVDGGVEFALKVVPGASRDRVVGVLGEALKVTVSAAPEGGKANKAVEALIAKALGVGRRDVAVVSGLTNPSKRVRVTGVDASAVRALVQ